MTTNSARKKKRDREKINTKDAQKKDKVGVRAGAEGANILLLEDETLLPRWWVHGG